MSSRMGCHCWNTDTASTNSMPVFADIGCKWIRATRAFQMDIVATGPKEFDFKNNGEESIDIAIANGMSIMGILDARWGHECNMNKLPWASPIWEHWDIWEDFVTQTVLYYKDRVKYWEIINEPPFFWWYPTEEGLELPESNQPLKRAPLHHYAQLLKISAKVIRGIDPEAKIIMGSTFADGQLLRALYELDCKSDFDIVSVHYLGCKHPEEFQRGMESLKKVMREFQDQEKPIWDTENGSFGAIIGNAVQTPAEYEALYNIYRHCFAYEYGLDRYFWFNPVSAGESGAEDSPSVFTSTGEYTPTYRSMKTLHQYVGEKELSSFKHMDKEVHVYVFGEEKEAISILWSTAPAIAYFKNKKQAWDIYGKSMEIYGEIALTGKPLFIKGNIIQNNIKIKLLGERETISKSMKQPSKGAKHVNAYRVAAPLKMNSIQWRDIPYVARKDEVGLSLQHPIWCQLSESVRADVKIAYDDEVVYLKVEMEETTNLEYPTGLVQFTMRDSNPSISEWPYFLNGYALFNLFASMQGPKFLRYGSLFPDKYPSGWIKEVEIDVSPNLQGITIFARIPWGEIGPCTPPTANPFLMMFTFLKVNNILDLPATDFPEEWSHNFMDNFIARDPALSLWVDFK